MEIKVEAKTVVANEGGFEPHPESYTPRVFAVAIPPIPPHSGSKVYEILMNGQAIPWPVLPVLEGFDFWILYVEYLSDIYMHRVPKPKVQKFWAGTNVPYDQPCPLSVAFAPLGNHDPVPQSDGFSESGTPTWIGEIDGKKPPGLRTQETVISLTDEFGKKCYGLGNVEIPKSGNLSHLPEGSH